jgi:inner membrane protein
LPTVFTHAIAGAAIGCVLAPRKHMGTVTALAAAAAVLPDADVLGFRLGFHYGDLFGHRGFTHSLLFAGIVALGVAFWFRRRWAGSPDQLRIAACIFAATASHGLLDGLTDGGFGIAFFAPFDNTRYSFPVTPIRVAPLRAAALFTQRGARVLASEAIWVWIPSVAAGTAAMLLRRRPARRQRS